MSCLGFGGVFLQVGDILQLSIYIFCGLSVLYGHNRLGG